MNSHHNWFYLRFHAHKNWNSPDGCFVLPFFFSESAFWQKGFFNCKHVSRWNCNWKPSEKMLVCKIEVLFLFIGAITNISAGAFDIRSAFPIKSESTWLFFIFTFCETIFYNKQTSAQIVLLCVSICRFTWHFDFCEGFWVWPQTSHWQKTRVR